MKKALLIPQLSMSDGNRWEVAKDGNVIIMSLFGEILKKVKYECSMYLPVADYISSTKEEINESIFFVGLELIYGNFIYGSAADYRFSFDLMKLKWFNKCDIDLIVTSIPEQVPALRVIFGNDISIVSILSYITYNNPTVITDYFFEQYAGLRKSNLCFCYGEERKLYLSGIEYCHLPFIKIFPLNLAFSKKRLKQQLFGFKSNCISTDTTIFIPTRLEDDIRTKYKSIIRLAKKYDNRGFKFIFANPGGAVCKELESANLRSQFGFEIENREDYVACLKYSDAIAMFNDTINHFSVAYHEAMYLNGNVLRNEEEFEYFIKTKICKTTAIKDDFSLEKRASDIVTILKMEIGI